MRIIRSIRKKISSKCGETLTETLSSLLIIIPAMVMLAGAIVTAARINSEARSSKATTLPTYSSAVETAGTITGNDSSLFNTTSIKWCNENNSVYYYFR